MSLTTRDRIMQRVQQARSPAPRAASAVSQARITEAAVVPGGWFGGWLGVSPYWWQSGGGGGGGNCGVTDGSDAAPGQVGEYLQLYADIPYGTTGQQQVVTVGIITPGDWDVWAYAYFTTPMNDAMFTLDPVPPGFSNSMGAELAQPASEWFALLAPTVRANLTAPVQLSFQTSTNSIAAGPAAGTMQLAVAARRMR